MERLESVAMAPTQPNIYLLIMENEREVAKAFGVAIAQAQERTWLRSDMDPVAFAVFLQTFFHRLNFKRPEPRWNIGCAHGRSHHHYV